MSTKLLNSMWRIVLALVFSLALMGFPNGHAAAAGPYTVTSLSDASDSTPGDGICYVTDVGCTLRAAIQEANVLADADTITFSVSGTISLGSSLPDITTDVTIDGSGQDVTISGMNAYRVMTVKITGILTANALNIINGSASDDQGGGINNQYGTLTVIDSTFSGNNAKWGGAINNYSGTLTVSDSTFLNNQATYGGAIDTGWATVTNSTFSGNTATLLGGGLFLGISTQILANNTFSGNSAYQGGGLFSDSGVLTLTNSTFSGNSASGGGGAMYKVGGTLYLKNTIMANSVAGSDCRYNAAPASDINNLIENNDGCGTPVSSADPLLGSLADNGGPTLTFALLTGSPAYDAGDDATCAAAPVNNLDQRGIVRPHGAHCDIGSYEDWNYTVSNLNDSGAGSLRQAVTYANSTASVGETIYFTISGTITLESTLPDITDDLTIDGYGQSITISGANTHRVMYISPGKNVILNALTFKNGSAPSTGGVIHNDISTLTIKDCTFSGNSAASFGGGIYSTFGALTVVNSTFSGNNGTGGGAIYSADGTTTITESTFSGNSTAGDGGGIYSQNDFLIVKNSTFSSNSAAGSGGGIYSSQSSGTTLLANSTFSGNSAGYGGGFANYDATLAVTNSTFSANQGSSGGGGLDNINGTLSLENTILANSTSGVDCFTNKPPDSDINNLIESNDGCGTPDSSADPRLGPLADNGGPSQSMRLLPGSPAIDAGDDGICAADPVNGLDQRGVTRPYGAHCDIGSYELKKGSLTTQSVGTYDGYVLESGENSNVGGTRDSTSSYFNLGDEAGDKQYRAVLSFNTASLPDNAVIMMVTIKIKKQGGVGSNPFSILGGLKIDIRKPYFGSSLALLASDFQSAAGRSIAGAFASTPVNNWYMGVLSNSGFPYINKTGTTQFRLRFAKDDNDDGSADYMKFYSGNYTGAASRPTLIIEYYVP